MAHQGGFAGVIAGILQLSYAQSLQAEIQSHVDVGVKGKMANPDLAFIEFGATCIDVAKIQSMTIMTDMAVEG